MPSIIALASSWPLKDRDLSRNHHFKRRRRCRIDKFMVSLHERISFYAKLSEIRNVTQKTKHATLE